MPFFESIPWHQIAVIEVSANCWIQFTTPEGIAAVVVVVVVVVAVQPDTSEAAILALPAKLNAIPLNVRWKMQQRCLEVFHGKLHTLYLHVDTLTDVFIQRYQDVYVNPTSATYQPPELLTAAEARKFKCVPGFGSMFHCPEGVGDLVDMNIDGVGSMDLGDDADFATNGLTYAVQAYENGNKGGAVLLWKRWINLILGDTSAERSQLITRNALAVGAAFSNIAHLVKELGRCVLSLVMLR